MRSLPPLFLLAVAACAPTPSRGPVLPGLIDAPPPPMTAAGDSVLTGTVWTWRETLTNDGTRVVPNVPERYTLLFQPGGRVDVVADCNRGSASYTLSGSALSFGPIALTRMMCREGSHDAAFLRDLQAVSGQLFRGDELVLTLARDKGSMRFTTPRQ